MAGFFILLAFLFLVVIVGISVLVPAVGEAMERARVEREAAEASWRIHQQATQAFGQMLDAARQHQAGPASEEES